MSESITDTSKFDLKSLFETSKLFNSTYNVSFISQHILRSVMGKFLISKAGIWLDKQNSNQFIQIETKGKFKSSLEKADAEEIFSYCQVEGLHAFPLAGGNHVIGYLLIGKSLTGKEMSDPELIFLRSLLEFASNAFGNAIKFENLQISNHELAIRVHELNTLFDVSRELAGLLNVEQVLHIFSLSIIGNGIFQSIYVYEKKEDHFNQVYKRGSTLKTGQFLVKTVDTSQSDFIEEIELTEIGIQLGIKGSFLLVPLSQAWNGLVLFKKSPISTWLPSMFGFYESLTNILEITLANVKNFKDSLEKQNLENEIKIARDIQMALLPRQPIVLGNLDVFGWNLSSKMVGGDYFDIIRIDDHRLLVAIADVTGKGTPASLLMANLQSMIKVLTPLNLSLSEMTAKINDVIYQNTASDKFITFFWGIVDIQQKSFEYVNAGHNPPYILSDGKISELNIGGIILGVISSMIPYEIGKIEFKEGDKLFIFTDGVTEAMNSNYEEYGENKVTELLNGWKSDTSEAFVSKVYSDVLAHCASTPQSDDITMIALQWKK